MIGPLQERPDPERAAYDPEFYGDQWSPVLIPWTDPTEDPRLAGPTVGMGGSLRIETFGPAGFEKPKSVYVTGMISLDGPQLPKSRRPAKQPRSQSLSTNLGIYSDSTTSTIQRN